MDVKEYLQKREEEELSSVLSESDKEYCKQLAEKYAVQKKKKNAKFWSVFSSAAASIAVVVTVVCVVCIPRNSDPSGLRYQDDKIVFENSSIESVNKDSKYFDIHLLDNTTIDLSLSYDSESGDNLYYSLQFDDIFESSTFIIVVNEHYDYKFELSIEPVTVQLQDYSISYEKNEFVSDLDGITQADYRGWIKLQTETVYFTYTQYPSLDDDAFFTYIEQVVNVK